jgi:hypothetical protein
MALELANARVNEWIARSAALLTAFESVGAGVRRIAVDARRTSEHSLPALRDKIELVRSLDEDATEAADELARQNISARDERADVATCVNDIAAELWIAKGTYARVCAAVEDVWDWRDSRCIRMGLPIEKEVVIPPGRSATSQMMA